MTWSHLRILVGSILFGFVLQSLVHADVLSQVLALILTIPCGIIVGFVEYASFGVDKAKQNK